MREHLSTTRLHSDCDINAGDDADADEDGCTFFWVFLVRRVIRLDLDLHVAFAFDGLFGFGFSFAFSFGLSLSA